MAFDPMKPAEGDDLDAAEVRDQLNALKALIDGLQAQVNFLSPALNYAGNGAYSWQWNGANPNLWQFQFSADGQDWQNYGDAQGADRDGNGAMDQNGFYRIFGANAQGRQITPFSNVVQVSDL